MSAPRWTHARLLALAAHAVGKVDFYGRRGAVLVSQDEIEAMAAVLALFGLRPTDPAPTATAASLPQDTSKGSAND